MDFEISDPWARPQFTSTHRMALMVTDCYFWWQWHVLEWNSSTVAVENYMNLQGEEALVLQAVGKKKINVWEPWVCDCYITCIQNSNDITPSLPLTNLVMLWCMCCHFANRVKWSHSFAISFMFLLTLVSLGWWSPGSAGIPHLLHFQTDLLPSLLFPVSHARKALLSLVWCRDPWCKYTI